jgi:hypothetical protein
MTIRISFLAPYPRFNGERKHQEFATIAEAKNMIDFYDSLGSYDAKVETFAEKE